MDVWTQLLVITVTVLIGIEIVLFVLLGTLMQQLRDLRECFGAIVRPDLAASPSLPAGSAWITSDQELAELERQLQHQSRERHSVRQARTGSSKSSNG